jgi:hypothetical protein
VYYARQLGLFYVIEITSESVRSFVAWAAIGMGVGIWTSTCILSYRKALFPGKTESVSRGLKAQFFFWQQLLGVPGRKEMLPNGEVQGYLTARRWARRSFATLLIWFAVGAFLFVGR